jgi:hypothetical protein
VKRGKKSDIHVNPAPGTEIKSPHVSRATSSISARQGAPDGDAAEATQRATRDAKRAIRADIRATMRAMHPHRRSFKSQAACEFVVRAPPLAGRGLLLAYRALGDEICVDAAVATLASRGWRVAFPSIDARGNMQLVEISINASMPDPFQAEHWTLDRHAIRAPHSTLTPCWCRQGPSTALVIASVADKGTTIASWPVCGPMRALRPSVSPVQSKSSLRCRSTPMIVRLRGSSPIAEFFAAARVESDAGTVAICRRSATIRS